MSKLVGDFETVDVESSQRLIDAIENALQRAGAENLEEGVATAQKFFDFVSANLPSFANRVSLGNVLQQLQMSPEQEQMLVAVVENLPTLIGVGTQILSSEIRK